MKAGIIVELLPSWAPSYRRAETRNHGNKRRVMNDALGGLGGVNSISDVRLDLTIYEPLIVCRRGDENENGMRTLLDISA